MLIVNPKERYKPQQILEHPWIKEVKKKKFLIIH